MPLADAFQALSVFMFIFAILNKIIVRVDKDYSLGFLYSGILFVLQGIAVLFISENTALPNILKDVTFEIHVIFNLIGYAAFSSAFLIATMYLFLTHEIKSDKMGFFLLFYLFNDIYYFPYVSTTTNTVLVVPKLC